MDGLDSTRRPWYTLPRASRRDDAMTCTHCKRETDLLWEASILEVQPSHARVYVTGVCSFCGMLLVVGTGNVPLQSTDPRRKRRPPPVKRIPPWQS